MPCEINLITPLDSGKIRAIMSLDGSLAERYKGQDTRVLIDSASIMVDKVVNQYHLSLCGKHEQNPIAITIVGQTWGALIATAAEVLSKNFKVREDVL